MSWKVLDLVHFKLEKREKPFAVDCKTLCPSDLMDYSLPGGVTEIWTWAWFPRLCCASGTLPNQELMPEVKTLSDSHWQNINSFRKLVNLILIDVNWECGLCSEQHAAAADRCQEGCLFSSKENWRDSSFQLLHDRFKHRLWKTHRCPTAGGVPWLRLRLRFYLPNWTSRFWHRITAAIWRQPPIRMCANKSKQTKLLAKFPWPVIGWESHTTGSLLPLQCNVTVRGRG